MFRPSIQRLRTLMFMALFCCSGIFTNWLLPPGFQIYSLFFNIHAGFFGVDATFSLAHVKSLGVKLIKLVLSFGETFTLKWYFSRLISLTFSLFSFRFNLFSAEAPLGTIKRKAIITKKRFLWFLFRSICRLFFCCMKLIIKFIDNLRFWSVPGAQRFLERN